MIHLPFSYLLLDVSGNNVRGRASELRDGCCNRVGYLVCHRHTGLAYPHSRAQRVRLKNKLRL